MPARRISTAKAVFLIASGNLTDCISPWVAIYKNHPPQPMRRAIIFYTVNGSMPFVFVGRILNVKLKVLSFMLYSGKISGPHELEPVPPIL